MPDGYVLFVSRPTGYVLVERDGDPPPFGAEVENGDERLRVLKVGASPLPGDRRRCVFTEPA